MKPRTLLVLLVLVAGLGSFIWFYERELPSSEERAKLEKRVLQVEKDDVTALTLESDSGTVRLEKVKLPAPAEEKTDDDEITPPLPPDSEWHLRQPLDARADAFAVDGLLEALTTLEQTRVLEDVDPKQAGLDKPRATVRLQTDEGETVLRIGAPDPLGGSTLASIEGEGDQAFVVSDSILADVRKAPGDWRDKQMFRGNRDEVQRVTLSSGVVLVPRGDNFHIESPVKDRADREKVDDLFAELSGLMAERFLEQPLGPRRAAVEVAFKQGPPVRIEIGPPASEELVQARAGSQVFEARTRLAEIAARPAAEWRSQTLSGLDVFQVESATIQDGQGKLTLQRAEPDWKRGEETVSYLPVSDFLFALVQARAERLLSPQEAAALGMAGKPALTVNLKGQGSDGKEAGEETLTLYPPVAAGVPARAAGRDLVLLLPAGTLDEIQGKLAEVRKAPPVKK